MTGRAGGVRTVVGPTGTFEVVAGGTVRAEALALVPLVDATTGRPPGQVRATTHTPAVTAHVTAGTLVLAGVPARAWPHLVSVPQTVTVVLDRPGLPVETLAVVVPAGSALPWRAPAHTVASPVVAVGGVVRDADFPSAAVAGAEVELAGRPGTPLVALRAPLALAHAAGATVGTRALTPTGVAVAAAAPAGATRVVVAPVTGIGAGTVLALGPVRREQHVVVDGTEPGGVVRLRTPLVRSLPDGAAVRRFSTGGLGPTTTLAAAALAGDGVLRTDVALTPPPGSVVEVSGGVGTELRSTGARTGTDGAWRLDGVRGTGALVVTVTAGARTTGPRTRALPPGADPAVLDTDLP